MHLLIDFSDVLQTNLYVLGNLYLKIIKLLNFDIPQIDPSLFIQRFCNKLKFGAQANAIANTSLKILQSMKRNWLHLGRRPNGLCGAAILISASCHQQKKSLEEIVDVVHVCNGTIKKRIKEFTYTPTSNMTKEELDNTPLLDNDALESLMYDQGMDPPSFIANRVKDFKIYEKDVMKQTLEIERLFYDKLNSLKIKPNTQVKIQFLRTTDKIDPKRYVLEPYPKNIYSYKKKPKAEVSIGEKDTASTLSKRRSSRILSRKNSSSCDKTESKDGNESEELSDLEEEEVELYCLTSEEQKLKKNLWEVMYQDWLDEQEVKKKEREKQNKLKNTMKEFNTQPKEDLFVKKKRRISYNQIKNIPNIPEIHDLPVIPEIPELKLETRSSRKYDNFNIHNLENQIGRAHV